MQASAKVLPEMDITSEFGDWVLLDNVTYAAEQQHGSKKNCW